MRKSSHRNQLSVSFHFPHTANREIWNNRQCLWCFMSWSFFYNVLERHVWPRTSKLDKYCLAPWVLNFYNHCHQSRWNSYLDSTYTLGNLSQFKYEKQCHIYYNPKFSVLGVFHKIWKKIHHRTYSIFIVHL